MSRLICPSISSLSQKWIEPLIQPQVEPAFADAIRLRLYGLILLTKHYVIKDKRIPLVPRRTLCKNHRIMYGKHFASMYCGSMVGAGFAPFSVMGYVIANMKPDKTVGFQVELNSKLLATIFGEEEASIIRAIEFLCAPDPSTRTQGEDGRRLVKVGTFAYRVVNGEHYNRIKNEGDRREQNRQAQTRFRAKKKGKKTLTKSTPSPGENASVKLANNGQIDAADAISASAAERIERERIENLPEGLR